MYKCLFLPRKYPMLFLITVYESVFLTRRTYTYTHNSFNSFFVNDKLLLCPSLGCLILHIGQQAAKKITLRSQKSNSDIIPKRVSVGNVKIVSSVQPQNQKSANPIKLDEAKFNKSGSQNTDDGSSSLSSARKTTENATESTKNVASDVTDSAKSSA
ncbi:hypothetical protein GcC1_105016, partial [Golovinomyces cichoracearum]